MDKSLPQTLPAGSSSDERETFERWHADHRKVRSIIVASMSNDIQNQYDSLDDVASILQRMKEVYANPDRHTRYVATKEFFKIKMTEGSYVQEHGVKMLSLVEKLEDLKAELNNDTYIDVILQSLPPSYDPFIVNFNMNGLEKSINELINILVQYEATTKKSAPSIFIGDASTSKAKGKRAGHWKRKKGKAKAKAVVPAKDATSAPLAPVGMGKGKRKMGTQQQSRANDICAHCREKGHWKRDCPKLPPKQGMFVVEVNMVTNSASWVLDTGCGAHICNDLQVLQRSRKLSKDEVVLKLGDGKVVTAEAVGTVNLVISDRVRLELKDCYFVPSMIKTIIFIPLLDNAVEFFINKSYFYLMKDGSPHLLGHISQDMIKRLVDSKSLEIDNLDNLPAYVCGPLNTQARAGFSYFITFIDDYSRYGYVYLMRYKSEAFVRFKEFRLEVENQKIHDELYRIALVLPGYALETAARLLNIVPSKSVAGTPYQIWHGKPASYKYLRVWGSPAYVKRPVGDKLDSRSSLCRFIGYLNETYGYYFYDHSEEKVFVLRNAVFLERGFPVDTRHDELEPSLDISGSTQRDLYGSAGGIHGSRRRAEVIRGYDFIKNDFDTCVYKKVSGSSIVFLVLYVDDILLIENDVKMLGDTKASLSTQFFMKDLGEASYIIGIKIIRDRSKRMLGMTQNSYVEKVLKRFKMEHSKRGFLPMRYGVKLSKKQSPKSDEEVKKMLSVTSRYQACAGVAHWTAVKTILKYLRRTKDIFLVYGGGELILEGYSDANFQSDNDDAKPQSGFVFRLNGGVVASNNSKQDIIADSTTEAEYIAALEAAKEAVWMKNYI
ncbi:UNVERIFIED_CONTAM: Copia protein [Sesamum latifolium]|uniref:Copia protein n=1 Tax=Sesamum latifolium TaxID=2727402 RepID=A0AAW2XWZ3_9LAMI